MYIVTNIIYIAVEDNYCLSPKMYLWPLEGHVENLPRGGQAIKSIITVKKRKNIIITFCCV